MGKVRTQLENGTNHRYTGSEALGVYLYRLLGRPGLGNVPVRHQTHGRGEAGLPS